MTTGEVWTERTRYIGRTLLPPIIGRDLMNVVLPSTLGSAPSVFDPGGVERGTLKKRSGGQFLLRALAGVDIRNADPQLGEMIDEYKKAKKLPSAPTMDDNTARGRARARLFQAILDEDADRAAAELRRLRDEGTPINTVPQVQEFIEDRHPLRSLRKEDRAAFVRSLPDEMRRSVIGTLREFEAVKGRARSVIADGYRKLKQEPQGRK